MKVKFEIMMLKASAEEMPNIWKIGDSPHIF
jgi:hypothetical protein